ncbi:bifunctional cobalt-precorrin-7 (C(5))-methyltransferase/cobalt-precorrin-6B (C(15))-methyltransferase [Robinsoniella sp. KNHs210]|uniref:bifunctional cobalt-precorrin-7 (C(5))-methyltransferase/cobalt-precorrin-6B (C(15))-methyltransferase n=1 Tax=Robinsoniella sp. KNHs210 TaxID=1469950 RepID=UPI000488F6C1|nr:bifunctional cobalt-precorrin-7 (C(5))-methyltransferase/cobalt-precorrin-6B (C(15))-methyltransferase [Robinsoniella sp. KNHs210]
MDKILIFAGTTEGRELAGHLCTGTVDKDVEIHVCTATEYGGQLISSNVVSDADKEAAPGMKVHTGRLTTGQMEDLMKVEQITLVIDATHPYAVAVSENIQNACKQCGTEYLRLLRGNSNIRENKDITVVSSIDEAVEFLKNTEGNVLVTTGSKELAKYTAIPDYQNRIFARVLSTPEVAEACAKLGFQGKNLICMQGPFSEELNIAMLKQIKASYLVTKDSGKSGGFEEKITAARRAGAQVVLIGRPVEETGYSMGEILELLNRRFGILNQKEKKEQRLVSLIGIGMGTPENMTREAFGACVEADVLIGAKRILDTVVELGKPVFAAYRDNEIKDFVEQHPEYKKIAVLLSGDIGFYSGAKKMLDLFEDFRTEVYSGISSVVYFCGKLHTAWEDVHLISLHGREANAIAAVKRYKKVFALIGQQDGVNQLCRNLCSYGFSDVMVYAGENLSYSNERILSGTAKSMAQESFEKLSVVLIENQDASMVVTHGIEDEAFLRDKVPMTKSEVRSISLSKLRLKEDSVIYDVGAGTGSVSVEMALQSCNGFVYAIEKKKEAVNLIGENRKKFAVPNLKVIEGLAPEALEDLPAPTHAFIGGSSGNLKQIMELILDKNPAARIVINAIALETVAEALHCLKELPVKETDIAAVSVGKSKEVGHYHMMMGQNPVYIISCTGNH